MLTFRYLAGYNLSLEISTLSDSIAYNQGKENVYMIHELSISGVLMRVPVQDLLYSSRETACIACGLWSQDMNLRYGSGHEPKRLIQDLNYAHPEG